MSGISKRAKYRIVERVVVNGSEFTIQYNTRHMVPEHRSNIDGFDDLWITYSEPFNTLEGAKNALEIEKAKSQFTVVYVDEF